MILYVTEQSLMCHIHSVHVVDVVTDIVDVVVIVIVVLSFVVCCCLSLLLMSPLLPFSPFLLSSSVLLLQSPTSLLQTEYSIRMHKILVGELISLTTNRNVFRMRLENRTERTAACLVIDLSDLDLYSCFSFAFNHPSLVESILSLSQ